MRAISVNLNNTLISTQIAVWLAYKNYSTLASRQLTYVPFG